MAITKHEIQSCCGTKTLMFDLSSPLKREYIEAFAAEGYSTQKNFLDVGIFYVEKDGVIANGGFNTLKVNVRCSKGQNCEQKLNDFETLLNRIIG